MATTTLPKPKSDWTWNIAPYGTVMRAYRGGYWVVGRTSAYYVDAYEGTCGCPHWQHRLKRGERCVHMQMLDGFLWRQKLEFQRSSVDLTDAELRDLFR